jgi:hypothetical protein
VVPNRFYIRRFLNRPGHHAGAYVLASVRDTSGWDPETEDTPWIEFEIADCSRRVSLDFPLHSGSDRRNSLYKARLLLRTLEAFVAALEAEVGLAHERQRRARATKKNRA